MAHPQTFTIPYAVTLKQLDLNPLRFDAHGFSFILKKEFDYVDRNQAALLLKVQVLKGDVVSITASKPAIIYAVGLDYAYFAIDNIHTYHSDIPLVFNFEFKLKPRNFVSQLYDLNVPYNVLKTLNFGDFYDYNFPMPLTKEYGGAQKVHNVKAFWTRSISPNHEPSYLCVFYRQKGVYIDGSSDEKIYVIAEKDFPSESDLKNPKFVKPKYLINVMVDQEVVAPPCLPDSDIKAMTKSIAAINMTSVPKPLPTPSPPTKPSFVFVTADDYEIFGFNAILEKSPVLRSLHDNAKPSRPYGFRAIKVPFNYHTVKAAVDVLAGDQDNVYGREVSVLKFATKYEISELKNVCRKSLISYTM